MEFDLQPFASCGELIYGMSDTDVQGILGTAYRLSKRRNEKDKAYQYKNLTAVFTDDKLTDVVLLDQNEVVFNGIDLFGDPEAIRQLESDFPNVVRNCDDTIFKDAGIIFHGFESESDFGRMICAFSKEAFNRYLEIIEK